MSLALLAAIFVSHEYGVADFSRRVVNFLPIGEIWLPHFLGHHAYRLKNRTSFAAHLQRKMAPLRQLQFLFNIFVVLFLVLVNLAPDMPWIHSSMRRQMAYDFMTLISVALLISFRRLARCRARSLVAGLERFDLSGKDVLRSHMQIYHITLRTGRSIGRFVVSMILALAASAWLIVLFLGRATLYGWMTIFCLLTSVFVVVTLPKLSWAFYLARYAGKVNEDKELSPTAPRKVFLGLCLLQLFLFATLTGLAVLLGLMHKHRL